MSFKKAVKEKIKLKIMLSGPSGSGKTYSALEIAKGIGGNIGVIDTENESSKLYADKFDFSILSLMPPYSVEKFIESIDDAIKNKIDVLIIDSISHEWMGEGGILDQKEKVEATGKKNSFTAWSSMTPKHNRFISAILNAPIHIICTVRAKTGYVLEANEAGKSIPRKVGMQPIQREGIEYEFTISFDLSNGGYGVATKDRTSIFKDNIHKIDSKIGKLLIDWSNNGKESSKNLDDFYKLNELKNEIKEISNNIGSKKTELWANQMLMKYSDDFFNLEKVKAKLNELKEKSSYEQ